MVLPHLLKVWLDHLLHNFFVLQDAQLKFIKLINAPRVTIVDAVSTGKSLGRELLLWRGLLVDPNQTIVGIRVLDPFIVCYLA